MAFSEKTFVISFVNPNGLFAKLVKLYIMIRQLIGLLQKEWHSPIKLPFFKTLWVWKHGFYRETYVLSALKKSTISDYVSDFTRVMKTSQINGEYALILNNKLIFTKVLQGEYQQYLPENYGIIRNGLISSINDECSLHKADDVIDLCNIKGWLVIKPIFGRGGKNVYILRTLDGELFLNTIQKSFSEVKALISRLNESFICEYIHQHRYASDIFFESVNTLRILTMWDYEQNIPFVALAAHRFGNVTSKPADNFNQGGLSCSIDLKTGALGKGASFPKNSQLIWHEVHPDTHSQIAGIKIPHWEFTIIKITEIAKQMPYTPYVGWDVVITEQGFMIIEANSAPVLRTVQMHTPLLTDPRVRKFYKWHNII